MRVIDPCVYVQDFDPEKLLSNIERAGRVCYKSEDRMGNAEKFITMLIKRGHESVLEHEKLTVKFVTDRATANQLVRHRIASYSQESTRYCDYSKDKFGNVITVIRPLFAENRISYDLWHSACQSAEQAYLALLTVPGITAELARSVLPHSLKTEIFVTANMREWRHILKLRTDRSAHPEMRRIMLPLLVYLRRTLRPLFADIPFDTSFPERFYAEVRSLEDGTPLYIPNSL